MIWTIEWDKRAAKEFKKLDKKAQRDILNYLSNVAAKNDPRRAGTALKGNLNGVWRYRIGNYRVVCQIEDHHCVILVIRTAHRREVYL